MKKTILLVDDDPICNLISRKLLDRIDTDLVIHTVLNGEEAIVLIQKLFSAGEHCPDLILLDLNMPVMDGFQFLDGLRKLFLPEADNPLIMVVSSSSDPRDIKRVSEFGVEDYLQKPLSMDVLRIALQSIPDKNLYVA